VTASSADVVIVGSGPVGAAAAHGLVEAGVDVLMLEAGTRPEPDRFAVMERALLGRIPWTFPPYPYEWHGDDVDLNEFAIRKLGGSSLAWGGITPRYQASDFELRTRYGVGEDWPLTYAELEPFYCRAERFLGISGAQDNPWASPRSEPFPMPSFPMNDSDLLVRDAAKRLGIRIHSVPTARNSIPYDGRSACCFYSTCRACPIGALYSSDRTVARLERRPNFRLLLQSEAVRIEIGGGGAALRVVYVDAAGNEHAVSGRRVILAVQPVETARLLLVSRSSRFPDGLANGNGMVGRYFLEHPKFYMIGKVAQCLHPYRQGFETATSYQFHDHPRRDEYAGGRLLVRECAGPSVPQIAAASGRWGLELRKEIADVFGRYVTLGAFLEQLPEPDNRICLSSAGRTRSGAPVARIDFRLSGEYERRGFSELRRVMEGIFDALGAGEVRVLVPPTNSGHYMGGHRMGRNPETSVTDGHLETHEVKNLYLAGGGAFPTSGVNNPTLTSVALAFRMVDHMLGRTA